MNKSTSSILKVCKVESLNFASYAIKQHVDLLGVHVLTKEEFGKHEELVKFISISGGRSIIVTKINDFKMLERVVSHYSPYGLQLHFEPDFQLAAALKHKFPELILIGVITDELVTLDQPFLANTYNLIIYDSSYSGGTGELNKYKYLDALQSHLKSKILLAGGIDVEKIIKLSNLDVAGFDVQSYFRSDAGFNFKNLDRVCDQLKYPRINMLSVSLTDLPLVRIAQASPFFFNKNLEYHLDYSLGSLYPSFNTISKSIEEKMDFISRLPFSLHLFIKEPWKVVEMISKYTQRYPLNLTRILVQYYDGLDIKLFINNNIIKTVLSIYYKDLSAFLQLGIDVKFISLIVPNFKNDISIQRLFDTINENESYFKGKEIWFDRNLDNNYITLIRQSINIKSNFIIGKEVIDNWNKINEINESLL